MTQTVTDSRQRFFIEDSPVRGDVVLLERTLEDVFIDKNYPEAIQCLLSEMLVATALLSSTIKIEGRLSIQLQSNHENTPLRWAMAECDSEGKLRALAKWNTDAKWDDINSANILLANLQESTHATVLFINIEPEQGQRYQGIVEQVSNSLSDCIRHYQEQSAQIPTLLKLSSNGHTAGGILVQQLPIRNEEEAEAMDTDLWPRLTSLTSTLSDDELLNLPAEEILYRLYHEEKVNLPNAKELAFGCTCSKEKCLNALLQLGVTEVKKLYSELPDTEQTLNMDCHFCGKVYPIDKHTALKLFN